ncbi:MAG: thioredoxin family protein [Thermoanaerobaculaceae bacterium]
MQVRTTTVLLGVFGGLLVLGFLTNMKREAHPQSPIHWEASLSSALAQASRENKVILLDFYTDWCRWCKKLDRETFANENVVNMITGNFVAVRLNAEKEGEEEAKRFGIGGYPTVIFVDPKGKEIKRISGYLGPDAFLQELKSLKSGVGEG